MATKFVQPVAIIGGGPIGLNIPHVLFERHPSTAICPRACGINQRTTEIFRVMGIEEDVYAISAPPDIRLEPILKRRAEQLNPTGIKYSAEVTSLSDSADQDTVTLQVRHLDRGLSSAEEPVHASFVICADGGRSFTSALSTGFMYQIGPWPLIISPTAGDPTHSDGAALARRIRDSLGNTDDVTVEVLAQSLALEHRRHPRRDVPGIQDAFNLVWKLAMALDPPPSSTQDTLAYAEKRAAVAEALHILDRGFKAPGTEVGCETVLKAVKVNGSADVEATTLLPLPSFIAVLRDPLEGGQLGPTGEFCTDVKEGDMDVYHDRDGAWAAACGVGANGAVLVRPDGIVGW
ncbi:uncharacterized protein IWZ02DRAFT_469090 [Phyllosticta citriasiana]|uniref:uncharacterized protein n=1 Tax=Phyllosticta citriasiana TaxID=595635 RepID=UPI0030FDDBA0